MTTRGLLNHVERSTFSVAWLGLIFGQTKHWMVLRLDDALRCC